MSTYTPAPWKVISKDEGKPFTKQWREIGPGVVSACSYDTNKWGEMETVPGVRITESNARLIAAAPELLHHLRILAEEDSQVASDWVEKKKAARAAIAKAEGTI